MTQSNNNAQDTNLTTIKVLEEEKTQLQIMVSRLQEENTRLKIENAAINAHLANPDKVPLQTVE